MEVKEINSKEIWENFFINCKEKSFLQSWNWGEFNKAMGSKIFRLGLYGEQNLIGTSLAVLVKAKRGAFLFVPHGPNMKMQETRDKRQVLEVLLKELKQIAKQEKVSFIRISPIWGESEGNVRIFENIGFKRAPTHMHPELTWELNISGQEEEILAGMRKTTRYLIRQGQKNEQVKILKSTTIDDVKEFYSLYEETKTRKRFTPFSLDYLKKEFEAFLPDNQISVFLGKYNNELVASGIFVFWQDVGFYHHGASSLKYPKIPISYLLLWEAIKEAKARGCRKFNFWGIVDISSDNKVLDKNHPWAGLTLFKIGFGGQSKKYIDTQDFILSSKYWLNFAVEKD